ncbi:hypothetical protein C8Q70DRAFT_588332 [Cubamyces menziesii]|nr:hypothetical protein C8Q70DRAFT_588332 [Cubamyces menziesii]
MHHQRQDSRNWTGRNSCRSRRHCRQVWPARLQVRGLGNATRTGRHTSPRAIILRILCESIAQGLERCGYLVTKKVPGTLLIDAFPRMDEHRCDRTAAQLRIYISDIRSLSSPNMWGIVCRGGVFHGGYSKYLHRPYTEEELRSGNPCVASSTSDVL